MPGIASMSPQHTIAHYRIVSKLGEGGMSAVYRTTDTKLSREVAIKILPDAFAADPDRIARFTHEAQVLASLNFLYSAGTPILERVAPQPITLVQNWTAGLKK
jgi:serine/threonine protein kinase